MKGIVSSALVLVVIFTLNFGCGRKEEGKTGEQKSRVEEVVKEAVTKDLKMYKGAKQALEKIEKESQEKRDKEAELK